MVSKLFNTTGGKVITNHDELESLLTELERKSDTALVQLAGNFSSVSDYNENMDESIDEYLVVLRISSFSHFHTELDRFRLLNANRQKNGISFIIISDMEVASAFSNQCDFYFHFNGEKIEIGETSRVPFISENPHFFSDDEINELIVKIQVAETVDTDYEHHPELETPLFDMDSTDAIRIPFALDKYNKVKFFEIGGKAPSHALIAGATGSGKSSALHTLIMQTISHYHPDDVEIWAIDYKAVEFNFYIQNPAPHFRVIAYDTTTEFSLSLIDLLYKEYEYRQNLFVQTNVKDIEAYRKKFGNHSLPRILVIVDEFQLMTQAVMEYQGSKNYRTELENLLRLTRAMGISFVFSSQTIASGLVGLSDAARDQIGCRLCLKHVDDNEIRETLLLSGPDAPAIVYQAKELQRGQGIYKRARWVNELAPDGRAYEYIPSNILFLSEDIRLDLMEKINSTLGNKYAPKNTITVCGGGRIAVAERERHPLEQFLRDPINTLSNCVMWYPAAPTTLEDYFVACLDRISGANMLVVGENRSLRESIVFHSVCGFLMSPNNTVIANFIEDQNPDVRNLINLLQLIQCDRLEINEGLNESIACISSLKRIHPQYKKNTIYLWFGLEKLKNEIFLHSQNQEAEVTAVNGNSESGDYDRYLRELEEMLDEEENNPNGKQKYQSGELLPFDECKKILHTAFDVGPENGQYHMVICNNRKALERSTLIQLSCFEHKIATAMSMDDSYALFGTSLATQKSNDKTVIYTSGDGHYTPLHPYLMPQPEWIQAFNKAILLYT